MGHVRNAGHLDLERNSDLLFDLLGRQAGRLRDHLRSDVGNVGIGLDRQLGPGVVAIDRNEAADHRHHQVLAQGVADEPVNH